MSNEALPAWLQYAEVSSRDLENDPHFNNESVFNLLADEFMRTLAPVLGSEHGSLAATVTCVTSRSAYESTLCINEHAVSVSPGHLPTAGTITFESLPDLLAVVSGQRLAMSLMRCGRMQVETGNLDFRLRVASIPTSRFDTARVDDRVSGIALWIRGSRQRDLDEHLESLGIDAFMSYYTRSQAEAISMSGIVTEVGPIAWRFETTDRYASAWIASADSLGPRWFKVGDDDDDNGPKSRVQMLWTSSHDFLLYMGRRLDFRDAVMAAKCSLSGELTTAAAIYRTIGRHGL
jgi:hypothetical protein